MKDSPEEIRKDLYNELVVLSTTGAPGQHVIIQARENAALNISFILGNLISRIDALERRK